MGNEKGNAGLVVLVTLLFVVVIAMAAYIAYDKLYVKDDKAVSGGNQNGVQNEQQEEDNKSNIITNEEENYRINSLAEASELVEKYHYFELGQKCYITDMKYKGKVSLSRTAVSDIKFETDIKSTASYANKETYLHAATFESENVDFYSYEDVQKTAKELFGSNANVEKKAYIICPNSYFYVEEYDGFVAGEIGCGSGWTVSQGLQVYSFENVGEDVTILAKLTIKEFAGISELVRSEEKVYKYTFKLQDTGYYLDSVEEI